MEDAKVDLSLVRTYRPAISLILGTLVLFFLHHGLNFLSLSERYTIIYSVLYVKSETLPEIIFDSTSALAFIAANFLIQDIRIQHTQFNEALLMRISNSYVISAIFISWTILNGFAIVFVDKLFEINQSVHYNCKALLIPYTNQSDLICNVHKSRLLSILLLTMNSFCFLLVSNSSYHETRTIWEENFKVWTFIMFSFIWIFKVDHKYLTYTNVYSFHHCIVRFSSLILFADFQAFLLAMGFLGCCIIYRVLVVPTERKSFPSKQPIKPSVSPEELDNEKLEELLKETQGQYSKYSSD